MTLIEVIKQALALADEYSPDAGYSQMFTEDEDFQQKLKLLFAQPYQELSQIKKIKKQKSYTVRKNDYSEEKYTPYSLPFDLYKIKEIVVQDVNTNRLIDGDYYLQNKKIYLNDSVEANYILVYYAYPEVITEETEDDFELEIDQDVQMILPYKAIDNILKTDPSADYTAFKQAYEDAINKLDLSETGMLVSVKCEYDF